MNSVESALLSIVKASGALFDAAVEMAGDKLRVRDPATGKSRIITRLEAEQTGRLVIGCALVDDQRTADSIAGRSEFIAPLAVEADLPDEAFWGGRRLIDVAEHVGADIFAAVLADAQRGGLAVNTWPSGGGGVAFDTEAQVFVVARSFDVTFRTGVGDMRLLAPAGEPPAPPDPIDAMQLRYEHTDPADLRIVPGALILTRSPADGPRVVRTYLFDDPRYDTIAELVARISGACTPGDPGDCPPGAEAGVWLADLLNAMGAQPSAYLAPLLPRDVVNGDIVKLQLLREA
ncbi:MAG: hypothetical protein AB7Q17_15860 [Phycisphaerae bacterium]